MEQEETAPEPSRLLTGSAVLEDALVGELLGARLVGVLATLDADGSPHAVPMWWAARSADIVLATSSRGRKTRNLERDPRATLVVHDSRPGTEVCGASIRGRVEIVRGPAAAGLAGLVHHRYLAEDAAALPEARAFLASDDVALVLTPESAWTWDERGNPATHELRASGGALPLAPTTPAVR